MAKARKSRKSPSRKRYEEENPTMTFRVYRETKKAINEYLYATECSLSNFVVDSFNKEKAMAKKRVEILTSKQVASSQVEDRLRCLEDLVQQIWSIAVDANEYPPYCPRCDNRKLLRCEGREIESTLTHPWVITWKCPKCGFLLNTYKRIDPKSIRWIDAKAGGYIDKPEVSTNKRQRKRRK